jgi:hypothetical protein
MKNDDYSDMKDEFILAGFFWGIMFMFIGLAFIFLT